MPFISVTPQFLLQVAPMQISATLQTQTDENETRWNDVTGTFLLSLSGLFIPNGRQICLFSVQELSFNIRVFFRQSKVLLDAYLKKNKTGSYPRLVCKISVKLYVTHDLEAIFYIVTKYSTPLIIID